MTRLMPITIALLLLLSGCRQNSIYYGAPVAEITPKDVIMHYDVKPGDTLYGIALKYHLNFKALADSNHIDYPYQIFSGQRLSLTIDNPSPNQDNDLNLSNEKWPWPVSGTLVSTFGKIKGIRIASEKEDFVTAVLSGRVVYSGSGIKGYGQLVIIEHDDDYMTIYGNNQQLLVAAGDTVAQGESIAITGPKRRLSRSTYLHFEVRFQGRPLDPLSYLQINHA